MKAICKNSRIEIWGTNYINRANGIKRTEEDESARIIQIQTTLNEDDYIVEVVDSPDAITFKEPRWVPIEQYPFPILTHDYVLVRVTRKNGNIDPLPIVARWDDDDHIWRAPDGIKVYDTVVEFFDISGIKEDYYHVSSNEDVND